MSNQPVLFLTHGPGPSFFLDASVIKGFKGVDKDSDAADFLRNLFKTVDIKCPKAILVLSAHWEETVCTVQVNNKPELYYDYSGFPPETYKLRWDVPGTADIAKQVKTLLESKGLKCKETTTRGLDHGVFVPLKLAVPNADIPGILYYVLYH
jgi:aromatic ring-opening dioxygenase catalytic subunit (LigB family)